MAITGLSPYTEPAAQTLRCLCGRLYMVQVGASVAPGQARERAAQLSARFIDGREMPFMNCDCGQALDFTAEASAFAQ